MGVSLTGKDASPSAAARSIVETLTRVAMRRTRKRLEEKPEGWDEMSVAERRNWAFDLELSLGDVMRDYIWSRYAFGQELKATSDINKIVTKLLGGHGKIRSSLKGFIPLTLEEMANFGFVHGSTRFTKEWKDAGFMRMEPKKGQGRYEFGIKLEHLFGGNLAEMKDLLEAQVQSTMGDLRSKQRSARGLEANQQIFGTLIEGQMRTEIETLLEKHPKLAGALAGTLSEYMTTHPGKVSRKGEAKYRKMGEEKARRELVSPLSKSVGEVAEMLRATHAKGTTHDGQPQYEAMVSRLRKHMPKTHYNKEDAETLFGYMAGTILGDAYTREGLRASNRRIIDIATKGSVEIGERAKQRMEEAKQTGREDWLGTSDFKDLHALGKVEDVAGMFKQIEQLIERNGMEEYDRALRTGDFDNLKGLSEGYRDHFIENIGGLRAARKIHLFVDQIEANSWAHAKMMKNPGYLAAIKGLKLSEAVGRPGRRGVDAEADATRVKTSGSFRQLLNAVKGTDLDLQLKGAKGEKVTNKDIIDALENAHGEGAKLLDRLQESNLASVKDALRDHVARLMKGGGTFDSVKTDVREVLKWTNAVQDNVDAVYGKSPGSSFPSELKGVIHGELLEMAAGVKGEELFDMGAWSKNVERVVFKTLKDSVEDHYRAVEALEEFGGMERVDRGGEATVEAKEFDAMARFKEDWEAVKGGAEVEEAATHLASYEVAERSVRQIKQKLEPHEHETMEVFRELGEEAQNWKEAKEMVSEETWEIITNAKEGSPTGGRPFYVKSVANGKVVWEFSHANFSDYMSRQTAEKQLIMRMGRSNNRDCSCSKLNPLFRVTTKAFGVPDDALHRWMQKGVKPLATYMLGPKASTAEGRAMALARYGTAQKIFKHGEYVLEAVQDVIDGTRAWAKDGNSLHALYPRLREMRNGIITNAEDYFTAFKDIQEVLGGIYGTEDANWLKVKNLINPERVAAMQTGGLEPLKMSRQKLLQFEKLLALMYNHPDVHEVLAKRGILDTEDNAEAWGKAEAEYVYNRRMAVARRLKQWHGVIPKEIVQKLTDTIFKALHIEMQIGDMLHAHGAYQQELFSVLPESNKYMARGGLSRLNVGLGIKNIQKIGGGVSDLPQFYGDQMRVPHNFMGHSHRRKRGSQKSELLWNPHHMRLYDERFAGLTFPMVSTFTQFNKLADLEMISKMKHWADEVIMDSVDLANDPDKAARRTWDGQAYYVSLDPAEAKSRRYKTERIGDFISSLSDAPADYGVVKSTRRAARFIRDLKKLFPGLENMGGEGAELHRVLDKFEKGYMPRPFLEEMLEMVDMYHGRHIPKGMGGRFLRTLGGSWAAAHTVLRPKHWTMTIRSIYNINVKMGGMNRLAFPIYYKKAWKDIKEGKGWATEVGHKVGDLASADHEIIDELVGGGGMAGLGTSKNQKQALQEINDALRSARYGTEVGEGGALAGSARAARQGRRWGKGAFMRIYSKYRHMEFAGRLAMYGYNKEVRQWGEKGKFDKRSWDFAAELNPDPSTTPAFLRRASRGQVFGSGGSPWLQVKYLSWKTRIMPMYAKSWWERPVTMGFNHWLTYMFTSKLWDAFYDDDEQNEILTQMKRERGAMGGAMTFHGGYALPKRTVGERTEYSFYDDYWAIPFTDAANFTQFGTVAPLEQLAMMFRGYKKEPFAQPIWGQEGQPLKSSIQRAGLVSLMEFMPGFMTIAEAMGIRKLGLPTNDDWETFSMNGMQGIAERQARLFLPHRRIHPSRYLGMEEKWRDFITGPVVDETKSIAWENDHAQVLNKLETIAATRGTRAAIIAARKAAAERPKFARYILSTETAKRLQVLGAMHHSNNPKVKALVLLRNKSAEAIMRAVIKDGGSFTRADYQLIVKIVGDKLRGSRTWDQETYREFTETLGEIAGRP